MRAGRRRRRRLSCRPPRAPPTSVRPSRSHCGLKYERILRCFTVQLTVVFTRRDLRARRLFMTAVVDKILLKISYGRDCYRPPATRLPGEISSVGNGANLRLYNCYGRESAPGILSLRVRRARGGDDNGAEKMTCHLKRSDECEKTFITNPKIKKCTHI